MAEEAGRGAPTEPVAATKAILTALARMFFLRQLDRQSPAGAKGQAEDGAGVALKRSAPPGFRALFLSHP